MPSSSPTNRRRGVQLVKSPVSGGIRSDRPDVRHPLTNGIGVVESKPMLRKRSTSVGQYRRRVLRLAGVVLLAGLAAPPAAVATPNFGDFGQSDGVGTLYGTRSEIRTPSAEINCEVPRVRPSPLESLAKRPWPSRERSSSRSATANSPTAAFTSTRAGRAQPFIGSTNTRRTAAILPATGLGLPGRGTTTSTPSSQLVTTLMSVPLTVGHSP